MIQRIQSVFLLIATILLSFMLFMPVAHVARKVDGALFELGFKGLTGIESLPDSFNSAPMSILIALCLAICAITIFLYKKRMLQIRLCVGNIVLLLGLEGLMFYYVQLAKQALGGIASYNIVFIFPLVAAILIFLALRAIARDEALVKSLDRLR
ncbi:MAG: DUF4293 domain-containing protein [Bacteroidales bacterium]